LEGGALCVAPAAEGTSFQRFCVEYDAVLQVLTSRSLCDLGAFSPEPAARPPDRSRILPDRPTRVSAGRSALRRAKK